MRVRIPAVAGAGAIAAVAAHLAGADTRVVHAFVLAAAVVVGELLLLRLEDGPGIPLSYAALLVIVAGFSPGDATTIWLAGVALAAVIAFESGAPWSRAMLAAQRVVAGAAALGAYYAWFDAFARRETLGVILGAVATAAIAALVADEVVRRYRALPTALTPRGTRAWLALAAAGALMALGFRGVGGEGGTGMWSVALFSIPLLAAWYSFERLAAVSRTHRQTLRALSMATELGGFVPDGHGRRVADLCERIAPQVGFNPNDIDDIVAAAYLHHLGVVTLDDPPTEDDPDRVGVVADVTAAMLADIPALRAAGSIVATQARFARDLSASSGNSGDARLAGQVLKVASDFDDLAGGEPSRAGLALEALYASPGYVYDRRVLEALEFVVAAR